MLVDFSWIFFRAKTIDASKTILNSLLSIKEKFNLWDLLDGGIYSYAMKRNEWEYLVFSIILLLVVDFMKYKKINVTEVILKQGLWFRYVVYVVLFWAVIITGIYGVEYDATQFIYFQF